MREGIDSNLEIGLERLGAVCELGPGLGCSVVEFAELTDGERLILHSDRGFSSSGRHPESSKSIIYGIYNTVLPDGFMEPDNHDWARLVTILDGLGVSTSTEQLQALPYLVEVGPVLLGQLPPSEAAEVPILVSWAEYDAALTEAQAAMEKQWLAAQDGPNPESSTPA